MDVCESVTPCVRADAYVAAEWVLELKQQHHSGHHDCDNRGRHYQVNPLVPESKEPTETDDAGATDKQHEPFKPGDASLIDIDALLPAVVNDCQLLQGRGLSIRLDEIAWVKGRGDVDR